MRIFKISTDIRNVRQLSIPEKYILKSDILEFDGIPKKEIWPDKWDDLPFYVYNPKNKEHDFWEFPDVLLFNEHALEICRTVFEMAGEILTVKVERHPDLYLLNILACINAMDYNNTTWHYYSNGEKGNIKKLAFYKDRVYTESSLFTIPETKNTIYCFADVKDRDEEFYYIYHDQQLTGLLFEEII